MNYEYSSFYDCQVLQKLKSSTRREKVEQREAAIIDAARRIFTDRGFAKTTMAEIARQSGVADGTVYLYFKNKEDLARAVVSDFYQRLTASAQSGVDELSAAAEQLRFLATHHLERIMKERRILELLPLINNDMDSYGGSELFDLNKNYVVIFDRIAKTGQAAGEVKANITPWILRDIFFGSMDYGFKTMMIKNRHEDIKIFVDDLLGLILVDKEKSKSEGGEMSGLTSRLEVATQRLESMIAKGTS